MWRFRIPIVGWRTAKARKPCPGSSCRISLLARFSTGCHTERPFDPGLPNCSLSVPSVRLSTEITRSSSSAVREKRTSLVFSFAMEWMVRIRFSLIPTGSIPPVRPRWIGGFLPGTEALSLTVFLSEETSRALCTLWKSRRPRPRRRHSPHSVCHDRLAALFVRLLLHVKRQGDSGLQSSVSLLPSRRLLPSAR